jgi:glutathione S-transferase
MYTLYGKIGSGSAAIEAALMLARARYTLVETASWERNDAFEQLLVANPLGQILTLVLADGSALSESAAILMHLGDAHPGGAGLGALDLHAAVVSKWSGVRQHLATQRPAFHATLQRIERHPAVAPVFTKHWPPQ